MGAVRILSFSQPWLWFVSEGLKLIENRKQRWSYRGPILLHASEGIGSLPKFNAACERIEDILGAESDVWCRFRDERLMVRLGRGPRWAPHDLPRGGIIGRARIVGCIDAGWTDAAAHDEVDRCGLPLDAARWWFRDQYGYMLADVEPLPFTPWKGGLGLRKAPPELLEQLGLAREAA